jgi:hypothetical protein
VCVYIYSYIICIYVYCTMTRLVSDIASIAMFGWVPCVFVLPAPFLVVKSKVIRAYSLTLHRAVATDACVHTVPCAEPAFHVAREGRQVRH